MFYPRSNSVAIVNFVEASINLVGILLGFSITIITILVTGGNLNLEEIKRIKTKTVISGQPISLFRSLLINFTYSVVIEAFLLLSFLIYPFLFSIIDIPSYMKFGGFSVTVVLVIHTLLLTVRNMSNLYFILSKEKDSSENYSS